MKSLNHFHTPLTDHDSLINDKRKEELVKMMIQTLDGMGFKRTVEKLVEESKVRVEDEPLTRFGKRVFEGSWDEALKTLDESELSPEQKKKIVFLINEQRYIELILNRQYNDGLLLLRNELVKNCEENERLKKLATILTCSTAKEIEEKLNIKLDITGVRQDLLNAIEKECNSKHVTAGSRLDKLIHQAVSFQFVSCKYHEKKDDKISLLEDHMCQIEAYPSKPYIGCLEHSDEVWIVKFSNKGDLFATVTRGGDLCIWKFDAQPFTPRLKHKISKIHDKQVNSVDWSPNDVKLLTASSDKKVKVWDTETGTIIATLNGHQDIVCSAVWIPGSRNFISGGLDNYLIIWNIKGEEVARIASSRVIDLLVSSDGRKLYSVCASHPKVSVIDLITQTEIAQIKEDNTICAVAVSKDNKFFLTLLSGSKSVLHLWDLEKCRLIQAYDIHSNENLKFGCCFGGTEDQFIACGSEDGSIKVWHRSQTNPLVTLKSQSSIINSLSWHPTNPHILISASDDRSLCIWVSDHLHERFKNGLGLENEDKSFEMITQDEGKMYEDLLYDLEEEEF